MLALPLVGSLLLLVGPPRRSERLAAQFGTAVATVTLRGGCGMILCMYLIPLT
jgi:hypothetical protein